MDFNANLAPVVTPHYAIDPSLLFEGVKPIIQGSSVREALAQIGLDWDVEKRDLQSIDAYGRAWPSEQQSLHNPKTGLELDHVSKDYEIMDYSKMEIIQPFLDSNQIELVCGSMLYGGKRGWLQAKVKRDPMQVVTGDTVEMYLFLIMGHNGISLKAMSTTIRAVCNNVLAYIAKEGFTHTAIQHRKGANLKVDGLGQMIEHSTVGFGDTLEAYQAMSRKQISGPAVESYIRGVLKAPQMSDLYLTPGPHSYNEQARIDKAYDDQVKAVEGSKRRIEIITELFVNGIGVAQSNAKGSLWLLYNALTEYLTHNQGANADSRLESNHVGANKKVAQRGLDHAIKLIN